MHVAGSGRNAGPSNDDIAEAGSVTSCMSEGKGKWLMKPRRFERATIQFSSRWKIRSLEHTLASIDKFPTISLINLRCPICCLGKVACACNHRILMVTTSRVLQVSVFHLFFVSRQIKDRARGSLSTKATSR